MAARLVLLLLFVPIFQLAAAETFETEVYAVVLNKLPPSAAYAGGHENLLRTAPRAGERLDAGAPHVQAYANHLVVTHDRVLASLNIHPSRKLYSYKHTLNAFAVPLTAEEVAAVRAHPEVGIVVENRRCFKQTTHTPDFLNIPDSLWKQAGGLEHAGEDIIIGVIDTGINPDHPSFSDEVGHPYTDIHLVKPWRGSCDLADSNFTCNNKLIGAKFFVSGILAGGDTVDTQKDFYSPRDVNGHGSHTASTAGGNHGVPVSGVEPGVSFGNITGMAPRARIAAYKGLWTSGKKYPGSDYGTAVDLLAALDEAVSDGVDVINYSIGPSDDFFDIWALGVLYAAKAGVFVSASAGNSGPEPVTLSHVAPWYLSVAASTHDREYNHKVTLGNGANFCGQGLVSPPTESLSILRSSIQSSGVSTNLDRYTTEAPLIWGANAAAVPGFKSEANWCLEGLLDPAKVKDKIVLCQRGGNGRVAKGKAVYDAGGVGMVLWNDNPKEGLITDIHFLPALHVLYDDGIKILKYINATANATASISGQLTSFSNEAPTIIDFSSRGPIADPLLNAGPYPLANDVLKPDIAAPGASIWAAFAPGGDSRHFTFNLISGTSMASPHVAGIGALIKQAHPDWDPFWIKSAIQTTATVIDNKGHVIPGSPPTVKGTPFDYGSGQINPTNVTDPGLVYPSSFEDYIEFLYFVSYEKALALSGLPPPRKVTQPRDLNTPNIAISTLSGTTTVNRTVLSVATTGSSKYYAEIVSPPGVEVEVVPSTITVKPGSSVTFSVTFSVRDPSEEFKFGTLTWTNGQYLVKSQLAIQPVERHTIVESTSGRNM